MEILLAWLLFYLLIKRTSLESSHFLFFAEVFSHAFESLWDGQRIQLQSFYSELTGISNAIKLNYQPISH